ncbi:hypothetical protein H7J08_24905 [Mycobacterium frederiksbergense]|uniref:hypothetical protein n=1 Tax=Mycolicibacterium frederiksbergense TaxID=117567 RepID=UPI0021F2D07F|nr:hypothetical protein [Mycolicibacterium frederiksbergense]MCV7047874.1 hypothetical protein [Mycolicibacterium frederiksbergense]
MSDTKDKPEVRAAKISTTGTIAGTLTAALIGFAGIIGVAWISNNNSRMLLDVQAERSSSDWLRDQRKETYFKFSGQAAEAMEKLAILTNLFLPGSVPPTAKQWNDADIAYVQARNTLGKSAFAVNLVGGSTVQIKAAALLKHFQSFEERLISVKKFFKPGGGASSNELASTVPVTKEERSIFENLTFEFQCAARDDLGVPEIHSLLPNSCR